MWNKYFILFFILSLLPISIKQFKYSNTKVDNNCDYNIERKIIEMRIKYKKMIKDNRIRIDLCDNSDKLGASRNYKEYNIGNNCEPWISRECIYVLDTILPYNGNGLEWSSGSSSMWLIYRLNSLISVENNKIWYKNVKKVLMKRNIKNRIKLLWFDKDNLSYCNNDTKYITKFFGVNTCLKTYATSKTIPNIVYDFISIDGRVRTGCFIRAIQLIRKENGIILLDNAERNRYQWIYKRIPSYWSRFDFWYYNGLVSIFITHKTKAREK